MQMRLLSLAASSCPPVLQMEVDGSEGPEVLDLPSDGEFEGEGDYEEGFFAEWWQEPKTKGDKDDQGSYSRAGGRAVGWEGLPPTLLVPASSSCLQRSYDEPGEGAPSTN